MCVLSDLAAAQSLDEHLSRQHGRFDDAFYWQERAHATSGGWTVAFRGIDQREHDPNLELLYYWLKFPYESWPFPGMRNYRPERSEGYAA